MRLARSGTPRSPNDCTCNVASRLPRPVEIAPHPSAYRTGLLGAPLFARKADRPRPRSSGLRTGLRTKDATTETPGQTSPRCLSSGGPLTKRAYPKPPNAKGRGIVKIPDLLIVLKSVLHIPRFWLTSPF